MERRKGRHDDHEGFSGRPQSTSFIYRQATRGPANSVPYIVELLAAEKVLRLHSHSYLQLSIVSGPSRSIQLGVAIHHLVSLLS